MKRTSYALLFALAAIAVVAIGAAMAVPLAPPDLATLALAPIDIGLRTVVAVLAVVAIAVSVACTAGLLGRHRVSAFRSRLLSRRTDLATI